MVTITPFKALRPEAQHAKLVASKPYDVLSSKEAKIEAQGNPYSFYTSPKVKLIFLKIQIPIHKKYMIRQKKILMHLSAEMFCSKKINRAIIFTSW